MFDSKSTSSLTALNPGIFKKSSPKSEIIHIYLNRLGADALSTRSNGYWNGENPLYKAEILQVLPTSTEQALVEYIPADDGSSTQEAK